MRSPSLGFRPSQGPGSSGVLGRRQGLGTEGSWVEHGVTGEVSRATSPNEAAGELGGAPAPKGALVEAVPIQSPVCPVQFRAEVQIRLSTQCSCPKSNSVL